MSQVKVNSEEIMRKIQANLEERSMGQYNSLLDIPSKIAEEDIFNREVNVAVIMRQICNRYEQPQKCLVSTEVTSIGNAEYLSVLNEVMSEIERINEYVFHNNMHASYNRLVGTVIEPEHPRNIRDKVVIFLKKIVRKATRFLTRDQAKVNEYFVSAITGLRESQMQNLKMAKIIAQMSSEHEQEKKEWQARLNELSEEIAKLKRA